MRIDRLAILDDPTARHLWDLYSRAFASLATRSATRQTLHSDEFLDQMRDARVWKFVGFDETSSEALALATVSRHLETDPWANPEYFQSRWPRLHAEGRIYYFGFVIVDPERQRRGSYNEIMAAVVGMLHRERALAGFDVSRHNEQVLGLLTSVMNATQVDYELLDLDTQSYYAVTFGDAVAEAAEGRVIDIAEAEAGRPNR